MYHLLLILVLIADLPHLTQLMPGRAERVLKLQDFDLEVTQEMSANCSAKHAHVLHM